MARTPYRHWPGHLWKHLVRPLVALAPSLKRSEARCCRHWLAHGGAEVSALSVR